MCSTFDWYCIASCPPCCLEIFLTAGTMTHHNDRAEQLIEILSKSQYSNLNREL